MKAPSLEMMLAAWQPAAPAQRVASYLALQAISPSASEVKADEVLPRREAAQRFHRHPSFIDRAVRAGLLAPVRLKGRKRACGFRASDLEKLMAGGE